VSGTPREIHLLDYWRVIVKRRWVVYTALLVLVVTVTVGSLVMRPVYTAVTRLQIEQNTPKVMPFQEVMGSVPDSRNDFYQTQIGLIQSRRVAGDVIASLELDKHDEYRDAGDRIEAFLDRLKVAPVRNSRLVDVSFSAHDPALAARVANRVADTYIAFNTQVQYNTTSRATTSLAHQIANLQEGIDAREKELQAYAKQHGIVELSDRQNIPLKTLNDLSDAYTRARATRIEKEARYAAVRDGDPGSLSEVLESTVIKDLTAKSAELERRAAQLSQKYKPDWPEMVRLRREIDETRARLEIERRAVYTQVLGVAESAWRTARNEEARLKTALDDQKRLTQEASLREIQYNNLKAEIANKRSTLEALLKRQAETASASGLEDLAVSNVRIVDVAEIPTRRSSPKILQNMLLSILTGLTLGVGLAFFFEYLDKSVKTPEEMHQASGVASIGAIPVLHPEGNGLRVIKAAPAAQAPRPSVDLIAHTDPKSKVSEAFREVRTALLVSQPGGPPRAILITSAQPAEGKTAVAVNLATTLAQIGRVVLIVDADLRKPRVHRVLGLSNDHGLSNALSGAGHAWPEPRPTPVSGLYAVTSGPLPPNPADLLDSERFAQIQRELAEQGYDHIIYDAPPVLEVADPAIMAGRMDAVLLVVRSGSTTREALTHAVARLQQVKARIVGAVLNRFDFSQQGYYQGYYGYKSHYLEDGLRRPEPKRRRSGKAQPSARV
jgi:capsular exopolysaccharide synthesis family protein